MSRCSEPKDQKTAFAVISSILIDDVGSWYVDGLVDRNETIITTGILDEVLFCVKGFIPNLSTPMLNIEIIAIGSQKNIQIRQMSEDYIKRLRPFVKLHIRNLPSIPFRSVADQERIRKQESSLIIKSLTKPSCRILLTEHGSLSSSKEFANTLTSWSEHGTQTITFILAGPLGHDRSLEQEIDKTFSLSPLTFPHEMAQMLLLEQLYRACTIRAGKTYHY